MPLRNMKERYIAEALGTFIFVFISIGTAVANILVDGQIGIVGIALGTGFGAIVAMYSVGRVSGAHLNPAITIAFVTQKKFLARHALPYIIAQILGATAGCMFVFLIFGNISSFGLPDPIYPWPMVFLMEFFFAFALMFVVMGIATDPQATENSSALPIGFAISMCTLFGVGITGAIMNPARSIAPAILFWNFDWQLVYWSATILGAILGALLYERIRSSDAQRAEEFGVFGPLG
jgi:aquaporin NIP